MPFWSCPERGWNSYKVSDIFFYEHVSNLLLLFFFSPEVNSLLSLAHVLVSDKFRRDPKTQPQVPGPFFLHRNYSILNRKLILQLAENSIWIIIIPM